VDEDIETEQDDESIVVIDPETQATDDIEFVLETLNWCPDDKFFEEPEDTQRITLSQETETTGDDVSLNHGNPDSRIVSLCEKLKNVRNLDAELDANTEELQDNARAMRENEQSFENRALGAIGAATVGLGGMQLAQGLAEQAADAKAEADMTAYMATMKCEYGGGQNAILGNEEITLPGGNELLEYYTEYKTLADNLKATKAALGMRPGIESEVLYDRAQSGLYQYDNTGITGGQYSSLFRANMGNENDQAGIDAEKEKSDKRVKIGATVAAVGIVATAVGNYVINHNNQDRTEEILSKRREIKAEYDSLVSELIEECNRTIQEHKNFIKELPESTFTDSYMKQYRQDVQNAQTVHTLNEIAQSKFCQ